MDEIIGLKIHLSYVHTPKFLIFMLYKYNLNKRDQLSKYLAICMYANEDYICWRKTTTAISESTPDSESLNDI